MSSYLEDIPCKGRTYYYKPTWTKTDLLEIAKTMEIAGRSKMTKAKLCEAIRKVESKNPKLTNKAGVLSKARAMKKKFGSRAMKKRFCSRHSSKSRCGAYGNICKSTRVAGKRLGTTRHACVQKSGNMGSSRDLEYFELLREAEINRNLKKRGVKVKSYSRSSSRKKSSGRKSMPSAKKSRLRSIQADRRVNAEIDALLARVQEKNAQRSRKRSSQKKNSKIDAAIEDLLAMVQR